MATTEDGTTEQAPSPTPTLRPDQAAYQAVVAQTKALEAANPGWKIDNWRVSSNGSTQIHWVKVGSSSTQSGPNVAGITASDAGIRLDENGDPIEPTDAKWGEVPADAWQLDSAIRDYDKARKTPAVVSYLQSESAKADEATRQFEDFLKRAKGVYDLRDSEQRFAMNADDQNAQNMKAAREGLIVYPGSYAVPTMDTAYSRVLAPSVPESVKPIYNLDAAVGLPSTTPGKPPVEGFNNSNYSSTGAQLNQGVAIPEQLWGSPNPISKTPDGQPLYVDSNGNLTTTAPGGEPMMAMGTDYHAMLMRKYLTGGL